MEISKRDIEWAAAQGLISAAQVDPFWTALENRAGSRARFDLPHLAYYFGALVVMSAMGWFVTRAWERFGGAGLLLIAIIYALGFSIATGIWLQQDPGAYRNYYEWVKGGWFFMEVGTILAGLVVLWFVRFPFLTFPVAFALWFMSMDLTPLIYGRLDFTWNQRSWVSLWFGLAFLVLAFLVDRRTRDDYAFWGYLFGALAFWGGLSLMESESELGKLVYCLINVALVLVSVLLDRRVFMVFGALGIFGYLGHLAYTVFKDSLLFPLALSALGLAVIWLGVKYQRNRASIEATLFSVVPAGLQRLMARQRAGR